MLVSRPPRSERLAIFVEAFWTFESTGTFGLESVLPIGRSQLLFNLHEDSLRLYEPCGAIRQRASGMAIQGPTLAPSVINRADQRSLCGVLFSPGGAFPFFGEAGTHNGGLVDLNDLSLGDDLSLQEHLIKTTDLHARLDRMEAAFLRRMPAVLQWDVLVHRAAGLLRRGRRVRDLANILETTQQTLIARFRDRTGLTPKTYARIERFQCLVRNSSDVTSLADAAIAAGYADQAHMAREFKVFSNVTPTAYRPNDTGPNHIGMPT